MKAWKLLGLAGIAGVAATGAVIARDERQRHDITPDDVRERLRARHATATAADGAADPPRDAHRVEPAPAAPASPAATPRWQRLTRRRRQPEGKRQRVWP